MSSCVNCLVSASQRNFPDYDLVGLFGDNKSS